MTSRSPPRVTVGLPFFDNSKTLANAVRSVLAQRWADWELLLVDDGSSDGSLQFARSLDDPRIRVISDGKRKYLAARLNEIAREARGELLARMDADDLMHPDRLLRQVQCFDSQGIDLVATGAIVIDESDEPTGIRGRQPADTRLSSILRKGLFVHPSVMFRASWARHNPYDEQYLRAQDLELWCRTAPALRAMILPEALLFYREAAPLNLQAYKNSSKARRDILRRYAGGALSVPAVAGQLVRAHVSTAAYSLLRTRPWHRFLLGRRSQSLAVPERNAALKTLAEIRLQRLPLRAPAVVGAFPRISIGLPFLNNRDALALALRSVFAQTLSDWELILVDDGSTDGVTELARSIRDPRVRLIADGLNRGLTERLNRIAALARAPLLRAWMETTPCTLSGSRAKLSTSLGTPKYRCSPPQPTRWTTTDTWLAGAGMMLRTFRFLEPCAGPESCIPRSSSARNGPVVIPTTMATCARRTTSSGIASGHTRTSSLFRKRSFSIGSSDRYNCALMRPRNDLFADSSDARALRIAGS